MLQCSTQRDGNVRRARPAAARCVAALALAGSACAADAARNDSADAQRVPQAVQYVAPGVYLLAGRRGPIASWNEGRIGNVAFVVGPRGVVVVDSGVSARHGEAAIAAVGAVTTQPIRLLVLTHAGQEAVFGAASFQARGIPVLMRGAGAELMATRCGGCLQGLRDTLGEEPLAGTSVVVPDRIVESGGPLDAIGRPLRLIAPAGAASGQLAVYDETTGTLFAGALASVDHLPDLRDTDGVPWLDALAELRATGCRHLVPAFGRTGSCADIAQVARYFTALDERVRSLLAAGVGLADVARRCDLPEFAGLDGYAMLHAQNAHRTYLRLERESLLN
jgi:glyoxylase-like metal-dependent hydrolase (beta-lactamase superfamily II)